VALSRPTDHGLPFSTWSLSKLADVLVAEGWSTITATRACGCCCARRACPFNAYRHGTLTRPGLRDQEASHPAPVRADGRHADVLAGDPDVVMCVDEFGPLNLQPPPGRQWTTRAGGGPSPRRRRRATSTRPHGVRHLLAAYDLSRDKLYGHIKRRKRRGEFLTFLRYLRTLYPQPLSAARGPGHEGAPHAHRSHYPTPRQTGAGRHPGCRRSQPPGPRSPRLNLPVEPGVRDGRDAWFAGPSCSKT
jgi:hypothetical protein